MAEGIVSFTPKLLPRQCLRAYSPGMARHAARYAAMLEACSTLQMLCDAGGCDTAVLQDIPDWQEAPVDSALNDIRNKVLQKLIACIDLAGLEFCDECSDVIDTIQGVSDPEEDADLPLDPWVHMQRSGGCSLNDFCRDLYCGCYVRLPGSKKYGDDAMIEAARAKLQEVRQ
jgi:hypothetical protein